MDSEKGQTDVSDVPVLPADEEVTGTRVVAFPDDHGDIREEKIQHLRPRGVEMKREMTKEDIELAAAGYEHLDEHKGKGKKGQSNGGEEDAAVFPPAFTPSINKTLNMVPKTAIPPLPKGLTIAQLKTRLEKKTKVKSVVSISSMCARVLRRTFAGARS